MNHANYSFVEAECRPSCLVIRDEGPWDQHPTITNDAKYVVKQLWLLGHLPSDRALFYYDSNDDLTQLVHHNGQFLGYLPCGEELP